MNHGKWKSPIFVETGFLTTSHHFRSPHKENKKVSQCLSVVMDDLSHYYMNEYPNRLIRLLNSDHIFDDADIDRVKGLISEIVRQKVSKYNHQPQYVPKFKGEYKKRVLVCDQTYGDGSVVFGGLSDKSFQRMLSAAIQENPDCEIIVKTHPDTSFNKKKTGYLTHLSSGRNITVMTEAINPYCLLTEVDKVYVGSSQFGFEALMAGCEVVCFGAPFYAGWGITDDRIDVKHRSRKRSLVELFAAFYLHYTVYMDPLSGTRSSIEQAVDHIVSYRPKGRRRVPSQRPKVSIIVPVHNVEPWVGACLESILSQSLEDFEVVVVDDASTDRSKELVRSYLARDDRIRLVELEQNVGLGFARNAGIKASQGEYIFFLDSDDLLGSDCTLEAAVQEAESSNAELVRMQKLKFLDSKGPDQAILDMREYYFRKKTLFDEKSDRTELLQSWHVWQMLFKRSLIDRCDLQFITRSWEERSFAAIAMVKADKVVTIPEPGVRYRLRESSISKGDRNARDLKEEIDNIDHVVRVLRNEPELNFIVTQHLVTFIFGRWTPLLSSVEESVPVQTELRKLGQTLRDIGFTPASVSAAACIYHSRFSSGRIHTFVRGLLEDNPKLVCIAVLDADALEPDFDDQLETLRKVNPTQQEGLKEFALRSAGLKELKRENAELVYHVAPTDQSSQSLRRSLARNRLNLIQNGLLYPFNSWSEEDAPEEVAFSHDGLLKKVSAQKVGIAGLLQMTSINYPVKDRRVILSSREFFDNDGASDFPVFFQGTSQRAVICLPDIMEYFCDTYSSGCLGWDGFSPVGLTQHYYYLLNNGLLNHDDLVRRWSSVLGKDNVDVVYGSRGGGRDAFVLAQARALGTALDSDEINELLPQRFSPSVLREIRAFRSKLTTPDAFSPDFIAALSRRLQEYEVSDSTYYSDFFSEAPWIMNKVMSAQAAASDSSKEEQIPIDTSKEKRTYLSLESPESIRVALYSALEDTTHFTPRLKKVVIKAGDSADFRIVNYGFFGWRLWLLAPVVERFALSKRAAEEVDRFRAEPAVYCRRKWARKAPLAIGLLYPNGPSLGLFRVSATLAQLVFRAVGDQASADAVSKAPILYFRQHEVRLVRAIGRILFPRGEMRPT
ncbi:glycosyltransferase [uncultured Maritimibacter sp.]|jgi:capsular polysaccharide export protein|uniref:capsular polysaccharide export protein, LipB/KpsS family n=1 Tax=uncultured Maritimibacter sp. TaxID=991866 RepID=UPI000A5492DF|nr:glycosyltransferase [uncultured Maritimibacter sp.]